MNQWKGEKRKENKSKAVFEKKKDRYLNNIARGFCNKDRDESNLKEKRKHAKFTTKFQNNGVHERRNRSRSRSESRNGNTEIGKQGTPPAHETENRRSKAWPTPDEQRRYPNHPFERIRFGFPLRRYQKEKTTRFYVGELSFSFVLDLSGIPLSKNQINVNV